uniref:C-type lectin domain-containing protein n=1 Tax=Sinocyclocheilus anshuiensis TaxID=1608454 RepID=A0A671MX06_9TELE
IQGRNQLESTCINMKMKTTLAVLLIMELYGLSSGLKQHFFVKEKMTWDSASKYCKTYFHDLSTFTNESEEQPFLKDAAHQPSDAWVGLYKESRVWKWSGGDWFWVNGDYLNYTAWYQNKKPQCPARDLHCGALDKQTRVWTQRNCEEKLSFFCSVQAVDGTRAALRPYWAPGL